MEMSGVYYILDGRWPIRCEDMLAWERWAATADFRVARDEVRGVLISTIFLGIDHGTGDKPMLFETMIFGGHQDEYVKRSSTWADAMAEHAVAVALVKEHG